LLHAFAQDFGAHFPLRQHLHEASAQVHAPPSQHAQPSGQHGAAWRWQHVVAPSWSAAWPLMAHVRPDACSVEYAGTAASANSSTQSVDMAMAIRFMFCLPSIVEYPDVGRARRAEA
jgi:hypothetical protein